MFLIEKNNESGRMLFEKVKCMNVFEWMMIDWRNVNECKQWWNEN